MAPNVINGSPIARRLNIEHRHALEFFFAEAVLLYGRSFTSRNLPVSVSKTPLAAGCAKKAAGTWTRSCAAHLRYVGDQSRVHVPPTDPEFPVALVMMHFHSGSAVRREPIVSSVLQGTRASPATRATIHFAFRPQACQILFADEAVLPPFEKHTPCTCAQSCGGGGGQTDPRKRQSGTCPSPVPQGDETVLRINDFSSGPGVFERSIGPG